MKRLLHSTCACRASRFRWSVHGPAEVKRPQVQVLGPPFPSQSSGVQVSTSTSINRNPPYNHHTSFCDFPLHAIKHSPLQFNIVPFHQAGKFPVVVVAQNPLLPLNQNSPHGDIQLVARCGQHALLLSSLPWVTRDTLTPLLPPIHTTNPNDRLAPGPLDCCW